LATPNEKLADSLHVLKALQDQDTTIFQPATLPTLTRVHQERLIQAGFLRQVIKGWYLSNNPEDADGDSTHWYSNMDAFVAAYANSRFGDKWQLSPELSLLKHSGHTSISKQLQLQSPKANNQPQELPHGCSLFLYRLKPDVLVAGRGPGASGLLLMPLPEALIRSSATFFTQHGLAAQIVTRQVDISTLVARLLEGGHSVVAGRLAGALRAVGRDDEANQLAGTMKAAGYVVTENNPFDKPLAHISGRTNESPYVQRIQAMWSSMRGEVIARFADVPRRQTLAPEELLSDIAARYVADAYHSLSIEGYRVNASLIEKVRSGEWSPLTNPEDRRARDAMAAKGYSETHKRVSILIGRAVWEGLKPAGVFRSDFSQWYVTLVSPSVTAGIFKAADLAGFRGNPVFIRNALHVPPGPEAVRDCMPAWPFHLRFHPSVHGRQWTLEPFPDELHAHHRRLSVDHRDTSVASRLSCRA
jgi:hypothetical protein